MGRLFDDIGNKMNPSHSNKKGKKYRYYITYKNRVENMGKITKLPAGEIENFVIEQLLKLIRNKTFLQKHLSDKSIETQELILKLLKTFEPDKLFIRNSINRIDLQTEEIKITYDTKYIVDYLESIVNNKEFKSTSNEKLLEQVTYKVKITLTPSRKNKIII